MSEPLTWQVLQALQTMLGRVQVANGFRTDIGAGVITLEDDQIGVLPIIVLSADPAEIAAAQGRTLRIGSIQIGVEVRLPTDRGSSQRDAHRVVDDLLRAIPTRSPAELPDGASALTFESISILPREQGASFISVVAVLRAGLTTSATPA